MATTRHDGNAVQFGRRHYLADPAQAATVREDVRGWLAAAGVPADIAHGVLLAVSEAVDNTIVHAYPPTDGSTPEATVELTLWVDDSEVVVTVVDHGGWVPPQTTALEHDTAVARSGACGATPSKPRLPPALEHVRTAPPPSRPPHPPARSRPRR